MSGSSQTVPLSVLPNFEPSAFVISGVVSRCVPASTRWIDSA